MKSFSPFGMATKAFFGLGARLFGLSAGGYAWVSRGQVALGGASFLCVGAHAGVALALDTNGLIYRSLNGGHTWTQPSNVPATAQSGGTIGFGVGAWITGNGAHVARSINNGTSWTDIDNSALIQTGNIGAFATDGAGNWIVFTNVGPVTNNYGHSADDGVTWTAANTFNNGGLAGNNPVWDPVAARWVMLPLNIAQTDTEVATSPDGATWTNLGNTGQLSPVMLNAGEYVGGLTVPVGRFAAVRVASAPVLLRTNANLPLPLLGVAGNIGNGIAALGFGHGLAFATDFSGEVASTKDYVNWTQGALNIAAGDFIPTPGAIAFDSVNNSLIAVSNNGFVVTL